MEINTDRIIGIFAPPRYGKTEMLRYYANFVAQHALTIIYDTNNEAYKYKGIHPNIKILAPEPGKAKSLEYLGEKILELRSEYVNFWLIIEDLEKFFMSSNARDDAATPLRTMASDSGHQRAGLIYVAKQPKYIPLDLISNTSLMYIGQFVETDSVNRFSNMIDAEKITGLTKPDFIEYDRWTNHKAKVRVNMQAHQLDTLEVLK